MWFYTNLVFVNGIDGAWCAGDPLIVSSRVGLKENRVGLWIACWHLRAVQVKLQVPPLRSPGFPVQLSGVDELRAAFLTESPIRDLVRYCDVGDPGPLQSG
jgi:hypothetical protein